MLDDFDPYYEWLGIKPHEQPPHHYRLLAIDLFEDNLKVIEHAADLRMAHLRTLLAGKHAAESQRLLNEVAAARVCLLNPEQKAAYDEKLREMLPTAATPIAVTADECDLPAVPGVYSAESPVRIDTTPVRGTRAVSQSKWSASWLPLLVAGALGAAMLGLAIWRHTGSDAILTPAKEQAAEVALSESHGKGTSSTPSARSDAEGPQVPPAPPPPSTSSEVHEHSAAAVKPSDPLPASVMPSPQPGGEAPHSDGTSPATPLPETTLPPEQPIERVDPPTTESQKPLIATLDEVYKVTEAKDRPAKEALARKLLDKGREPSANRTEQFVVLRRAGELARDAGKIELVLRAVDAIDEAGFKISPWKVKASLLKQVLEQGGQTACSSLLADGDYCASVAEQAASEGATDEASAILAAAQASISEARRHLQEDQHSTRLALSRASRPTDKTERETMARNAEQDLMAFDAAAPALIKRIKELQQVSREREALGKAQEPKPQGGTDRPQPLLALAPFGEKAAKQHQARWAEHLAVPVVFTNSIGVKLTLIPPGEFVMGDDAGESREKPAHRVRIATPFYLGQTELTQAQYQAVMGSNPSFASDDADRQVGNVSWNDAIDFCARLSHQEGKVYRLPSEAQWEYACRAGTTTRWCFGDDISPLADYAWYAPNSESKTHPVGLKRPNPWGLYDVYGNAYEFCSDWFSPSYAGNTRLEDPTGGPPDECRIRRGGCYIDTAPRSTNRSRFLPHLRSPENTLRLCLPIPPPSHPEVLAADDSSEIDLLKQTFQPVRGEFTFHEGALWVPPVAWATAQIAYTPPERYEVKVVATSMVEGRGDLAIGLTMSGRMFCVRLDDRPGWYKNGKYRLSGIDMAGTGTVGANESTREVDVFRPGVPCTVQVQVVPGRVRLACGDREIFDWRGDPSRLRQRPEWGVPNPSQLYIGGHQIQISQMTVRPIADIVVAEPANPKPEESVQPDAAAEPPATGSSSGKPPAPAVAPFADKAAKMYQKLWAKHLHVPSMQVNSIGMKLVLIPPGEFDMGSPKSFVQSEQHRSETPDFYRARLPGEMPNHHVRITKPFWIGASEVTQDEYQRVMGDNPSRFQGPNRPVEQVTWDLAAEFCKKLSSLPAENAAGRQYALPTEAQWEYACRAGDPGPRCFSNWTRPMPASLEEKMLADYAWFDVDAGGQTHPVGQARPNGWGLYDVHGNVWEWCSDWYGDYANSPADDPAGPRNGTGRVHRGGGWRDPAASCRSAHRANAAPANRQEDLGLRVVLVFREKLDQQVPPAQGNSR